MFATSRTESVMGRTIILIDSTTTKKGFNQSGAPLGRRDPINILGEYIILDKINDNHMGRPKASLNTICLLYLKEYGNNPKKLIKINIINNPTTIVVKPLIWDEDVRKD